MRSPLPSQATPSTAFSPNHSCDQRTDIAGEIELLVPVGDANLFVHWQPTYSGTDAPGWGEGWQHHIGTGMSFTF